MPLNINAGRFVEGGNGADGAPGVPSETEGSGVAGGAGQSGRAGQSVLIESLAPSYTGDPGDDSIMLDFFARGGNGGDGGEGGTGPNAALTDGPVNTTPTSTTAVFSWAGAGDGGNGGRGAVGGAGEILLTNVVFNLGTATARGQNTVDILATALGGDGGFGGRGGRGGDSGRGESIFAQTGDAQAGDLFTNFTQIVGTPSGNSGQGGLPGFGAAGRCIFDGLRFSGTDVKITLEASASGGDGGWASGTFAPSPGGNNAPDAQSGRSGRPGGVGEAEVSNLRVTAAGGIDLEIALSAEGGDGGIGAQGSPAGFWERLAIETLNGVGSRAENTVYGQSGSGGSGGSGGLAEAKVTAARVFGSVAQDQVEIILTASGGLGGAAGSGAPAVESSVVRSGDPDFVITQTVTGTLAGANGRDGDEGASAVRMTGSTISLGGGGDSFLLRLSADTLSGQSAIYDVSGNTIRGGNGFDTFTFGTARGGREPAMFINVQTFEFTVAGGANNEVRDFERFFGGTAGDRFLDGTGNHTYAGRGGADRYVFFAGQAGNDRVAFQQEDVIVLRGFGPALNNFADVQAAARQVAAGTLIQTSANSSILLTGIQRASLQADDFLF